MFVQSGKLMKNPSPPDPDIADFGGPSGPSPPQEPAQKVGGEVVHLFGWVSGRGGVVWTLNIDDIWVRGSALFSVLPA